MNLQIYHPQTTRKNSQTSRKLVFTAGHCTFTKKYFDDIQPSQPAVQRLLSSKQWTVQLTPKWLEVLKELRETGCQEIRTTSYVQVIKEPNVIFKAISHINFSSLIKLQLSGTLFDSIESIANLSMERLQRINLCGEMVTNLKAFNKTRWPCLKYIGIIQNIVIKEVDLSRSGLRELSGIFYEYDQVETGVNLYLQRTMKLETGRLESFKFYYIPDLKGSQEPVSLLKRRFQQRAKESEEK